MGFLIHGFGLVSSFGTPFFALIDQATKNGENYHRQKCWHLLFLDRAGLYR